MIDIVRSVAGKKEKREVSLPIRSDVPGGERYAWWTEAVRAKLEKNKKLGLINQKQIAHKHGMHPAKITNAISREAPVYDAIVAICTELKVPMPVVIAESADEALHLIKQQRFFRIEKEVELEETAESPEKEPSTDAEPAVRKKRVTEKPPSK